MFIVMKLKKRDKHLLYELSKDVREKQTEIAKKLRITPQTLQYQLEQLKDMYTPRVVIDPAKFGLITIRAFMSFLTFNKHTQNHLLKELAEQIDVVLVQKLKLGADVMVEYAVPNLSYFNKLYATFLDKNSDAIRNKQVFPVLVRYNFQKNYLYPRARTTQYHILSGDREPIEHSEIAQEVITELLKDPTAPYAQIARNTNYDVRTVQRAIHTSQEHKIIRSYDIDIDYKKTGVSSAILGVQFSYVAQKEMNRFVEYANNTKEIVSLLKVIGDESVFVTIETFDQYTEIINKIRSEFNIVDYSVFEAGNIVKNTYIPYTNALE